MKTNRFSTYTIYNLLISTIVVLFSISLLHATTHVILFGGSFGFEYSPKQLNVSVGDTIRWEGSFTNHPLSSTSVPQGAQTFHSATGSTFSYNVQVGGTYNYECDLHAASGMTGSFVASVTGVEDQGTSLQPQIFQLEQNYPNPFNSSTVIEFHLPVTQQVKLKVYSITGKEVATLIDATMPAGNFTVPFEAANLASGIYFYQLVSDNFRDTKRFVLAK
jgi:plastocyanin